MALGTLKYTSDYSSIVRSTHFDEIALFEPTAIYKETMRRHGRHCHLGHVPVASATNGLQKEL